MPSLQAWQKPGSLWAERRHDMCKPGGCNSMFFTRGLKVRAADIWQQLDKRRRSSGWLTSIMGVSRRDSGGWIKDFQTSGSTLLLVVSTNLRFLERRAQLGRYVMDLEAGPILSGMVQDPGLASLNILPTNTVFHAFVFDHSL